MPPFELGGHPVRSSEVRTAIAAGDIALAGRLLGRPHAVVGVTKAGWQGSHVAFELPMALPPDGPWDVEIVSDGRKATGLAHVSDGELVVAGVAPGARVRVAFLVRGGAA